MTERPFGGEPQPETQEQIRAGLSETIKALASRYDEIQSNLEGTRVGPTPEHAKSSSGVDIEDLKKLTEDISDPIERAGAENIIEEIRRIREAESRKEY